MGATPWRFKSSHPHFLSFLDIACRSLASQAVFRILDQPQAVAMTRTINNFGRNVSFQPRHYFQPDSAEAILRVMADHKGQRFRAIGRLHSWSRIQETDGVVIDMSRIHSIDIQSNETGAGANSSRHVTVGGGCQVKTLLSVLAEHGLTLPTVGLIDEQTVAGATATGTHGSGKHCLSHYIRSVTIAHFDSDGQPTLTQIDTGVELAAAKCSLGLLGIIVALTFECREKYNVNEVAAPFENVDEVLAKETDYPLQQFYLIPWSWRIFAHHRRETSDSKSKLAWLYHWYFFLVIDVGLHLVVYGLAKFFKSRWLTRGFFKYVVPLTIARNWSVVDDSHKMLVMEHDMFRHCEVEIFVQRSHVAAATDLLIDIVSVFGDHRHSDARAASQNMTNVTLEQIGQLERLERNRGTYCHHYPICFRRVLADNTLISMASPTANEGSETNTEDWFAISFISYQWPTERDGFFEFADFVSTVIAERFGGRCHWGKLNSLSRQQNERLYPQLETFRTVVNQFDPEGAFSSDWFEQVVNEH